MGVGLESGDKGTSGTIGGGFGQESGSRHFTDDQTKLIGTGDVEVKTGNHTQLDGAVIASTGGNVSVDTKTLGYRDLTDEDKYQNVGVQASISGSTSSPSKEPQKPGEAQKDGGPAITNGTIDGHYTSSQTEGVSRATIAAPNGTTTITIRANPSQGLDGLNRDLQKAQEVSKTKKVNVEVYIDSTAIKEIAEGFPNTEKLLGAIKDFTKKAVDAGVPEDKILEILAKLPPEVREKLVAQGLLDLRTPEEIAQAEKNLSILRKDGTLPSDEGAKADMLAVLIKEVNGKQPTEEQIALRDKLLLSGIANGNNLDPKFWSSEAGKASLLAEAVRHEVSSSSLLQKARENWSSLNWEERSQAIQDVANIVASVYGLPEASIVIDNDQEYAKGQGDMEAPFGKLYDDKFLAIVTGHHFDYDNKILVPGRGRVMADSDPDIKFDFASVVGMVAHEETHIYQQKIIQDYVNGKFDKSDARYGQAKMFMANNYMYIGIPESEDKYKIQPVEAHAYAIGNKVAKNIRRN